MSFVNQLQYPKCRLPERIFPGMECHNSRKKSNSENEFKYISIRLF